MKKLTLLFIILIAAIGLNAQTEVFVVEDSLMAAAMAKADSIMAVEEAEKAHKDSIIAALNYQYATQKIMLMADEVVKLSDLRYRPILIIDSENNVYATLGEYAVRFSRLDGRMWNKSNEEVRLKLIDGLPPEISFREVKTSVKVDPNTIQ